MRTTVTIQDALFQEAREAALRSGRTLSALVEEGLRRLLHERRPRRSVTLPVFRPPKDLEGVQAGVDLDDTSALLDLMDGLGAAP